MRLDDYFPRLAQAGFRITSPSTKTYNCIAWAAGDDGRWWEPDPGGVHYWPPGLARDYSLAAYIEAFIVNGYSVCSGGELELGFEKVAIYARAGEATHAARQLPSGSWTSKLGLLEDIEHAIDGLVGDRYGRVVQFLRRPVSN